MQIKHKDDWVQFRDYSPQNTLEIWSHKQQRFVKAVSVFSVNRGFTTLIATSLQKPLREIYIVKGNRLIAWEENAQILLNNEKESQANIERLIAEFDSYMEKVEQAPLKSADKVAFAIGSSRIGDFFGQIHWLANSMKNYLAEHNNPSDVKIYVNKNELFFDPSLLFPFLKDHFVWVESWPQMYLHAAKDGAVSFLVKMTRQPMFKKHVRSLQQYFQNYLGSLSSNVPKSSFKLMISLELEKRNWLNQVDLYQKTLLTLSKQFKDICLVINGMTGYEFSQNSSNMAKVIEYEKTLIDEITQACPLTVIDLAGKTLREKTELIADIDMFIAPIGSATILPALILQKPGMTVGYRNRFKPHFRNYITEATWVPPPEAITDFPEIEGEIKNAGWKNSGMTVSYSIDEEAFLKGLDLILERINAAN